MNDRRRINGPLGGTTAPIFLRQLAKDGGRNSERPIRSRPPNAIRKMFLKTGVTPSASGSAYLELESLPAAFSSSSTLSSLSTSGLKLTCTVHGPRPLPRSAPFTPQIILSTHVKYAPFATRKRRGYVRDAGERDLAVHLEAALRGVIIGDRWPKSGVEVIITILEGEEDRWWGESRATSLQAGSTGQWGMMSVLSGCITVASAAIADAGIDCVDIVSGGVAALVKPGKPFGTSKAGTSAEAMVVMDPTPSEHDDILAACVVAYLPSRDEITDLWIRGDLRTTSPRGVSGSTPAPHELLTESAVQAARGSHHVISSALKEAVELHLGA